MKVNDSIVDTRFYLLSRIFSSPPSHTLSRSEGLGLCFLIHLKQTNQLNGGGSRSHILPIFCPSHILKSSHHHRHRHQPKSQPVCPFISFGHRAPSCAIWVFVCSSLTPWADSILFSLSYSNVSGHFIAIQSHNPRPRIVERYALSVKSSSERSQNRPDNVDIYYLVVLESKV